MRACSTWRVAAVACDLDFVGASILAQLTAVLIVRPCLTFARKMRALLCFRFRHNPFPFYSARCDIQPNVRCKAWQRVWLESGFRFAYAVSGIASYCFGRYLDEQGSDI
jgi:hypothetical protein